MGALEGRRTGLVVLSEIGDGDPVPIVQGRITAGASVAAFVEVRGGQRPVASGRLRASGDAGSPTASADLFAQPLRRNGRVHRGSLPLPPLAAGDYVLELRIADEAAGRSRTVEVGVHVTS